MRSAMQLIALLVFLVSIDSHANVSCTYVSEVAAKAPASVYLTCGNKSGFANVSLEVQAVILSVQTLEGPTGRGYRFETQKMHLQDFKQYGFEVHREYIKWAKKNKIDLNEYEYMEIEKVEFKTLPDLYFDPMGLTPVQ